MAEPKLTGFKICSKCEKAKPTLAFAADRSTSDGLRPDCRECQGKRQKNRDGEKKARRFQGDKW